MSDVKAAVNEGFEFLAINKKFDYLYPPANAVVLHYREYVSASACAFVKEPDSRPDIFFDGHLIEIGNTAVVTSLELDYNTTLFLHRVGLFRLALALMEKRNYIFSYWCVPIHTHSITGQPVF